MLSLSMHDMELCHIDKLSVTGLSIPPSVFVPDPATDQKTSCVGHPCGKSSMFSGCGHYSIKANAGR
jgi:hypothetical protein